MFTLPTVQLRWHKLNVFIDRVSRVNADSPISSARDFILSECRLKAEKHPGFFSLTVPTGGGKTLSSMAFALTHAVKYQKRRIIYAIPFTSIIEQNAQVFRDSLGDDVVLEHHSSMDPDDKDDRNKWAAENWDAPIVVTTNVQLFESLLAHKPSKCRKLHNIVDSVIVIDEAQMLSPDYLMPTLRSLQELVADCEKLQYQTFGINFKGIFQEYIWYHSHNYTTKNVL